MRLEPGALVNERLRLVRLLGRGGMGSVWVAHHETLDIEVAVKFVAPELASRPDPIVMTRFKREAQLAAKLVGPHVVRVLDHGVAADDVPYIVMELLRGESLAERFARVRRLAPADAARIVGEIADGLAEAHDLGIVHRDIKPANLFLAKARGDQEVAKILDFGIARLDVNDGQTQTASGHIVGTPFYMSPEQLLDAKMPDKSADLWALAVVAYEALTGRHPFAGETPARTMMSITRAVFDRASTTPGLPPAIDPFFERAFALDRAARFSSAPALAAALREVVSAQAGPSSPVATDEHTGEFARSRGLELGVDPTDASPLASSPLAPPADIVPSTPPAAANAATSPMRPFPGALATPPSSPSNARAYVAGALAAAALVTAGTYWTYVKSGAPRGAAASSSPGTTASASSRSAASAAPSASIAAIPSGPPNYFFCSESVHGGCDPNAKSWCDEGDRPVACCAPGLVPVGSRRCACAPGGTSDKAAIDAGCESKAKTEPSAIQKVVRTRWNSVRACYETGLQRNPKLKGSLSVHFDIGSQGIPGRFGFTNASAPDPDFQDCVIHVFSELRFDPPVNGDIPITYPVLFSSD